MLVYAPAIKFAGTHLYTWVEGEALCPRTQQNAPRSGLEPEPLDPETSALTMSHGFRKQP